MQETVYICPDNPKHKQVVCVPVKEVRCGKCKGSPIMKPKEA